MGQISAARLLALMADDNWTQRSLAQESGISESTIGNILKQRIRHVHLHTVHALARTLKTSSADLLGQVPPDLPPDLRTLVELLQTRLTAAERRALIALLRAHPRPAPPREPKGEG